MTTGSDLDNLIYVYNGGGGGGGASMLRAQEIENGLLSSDPIVISGGGGGTAAILNYNKTFDFYIPGPDSLEEQLLYEYHIDAKNFYETDIFNGTTGAREYRSPGQTSYLAGAGGG